MVKLIWKKRLYALFVLCVVTAIALPERSFAAQQTESARAVKDETDIPTTLTYTVLYSFCSQPKCVDGKSPFAGLVQGADGNFYGTTQFGGTVASGVGTVFKITPRGNLTTLHSFTGAPGGDFPTGWLVQGADGNFYGITWFGGTSYGQDGTVFKITPSGVLTTIHNFCDASPTGICLDGDWPYAGLVEAADGNFWGTTVGDGQPSYGTVFKVSPSGSYAYFSFGTEGNYPPTPYGSYPWGGVVQGTDGDFYGTALDGGASGGGTVFKMTPTGVMSMLHNFCSEGSPCTDGEYPQAGLVQATDGNFYGSTSEGGTSPTGAPIGFGTIFKITPEGALTTLRSVCLETNCADGAQVLSSLIQATDGNLYGIASGGGANGMGTIFKITLSGELTTLYNFCPEGNNYCPEGYPSSFPGWPGIGALVQGTDGDLYGTTSSSVPSQAGTVFRLSVGLPPFVKIQPTCGKAGTVVNILGNNLEEATRVAFNGHAAAFKVISNSMITTAVPPGATTGAVKVITPRGTLSSNVPFRVSGIVFLPQNPRSE